MHNLTYIKSTFHKHPIELIRRFMLGWYCNECQKLFYDNAQIYHCTICDYYICCYCVKDTIIEGEIFDEAHKIIINFNKILYMFVYLIDILFIIIYIL